MPVQDIINYSTPICPFETGKCGQEGKKLQKREYLKKKKRFLKGYHFVQKLKIDKK